MKRVLFLLLTILCALAPLRAQKIQVQQSNGSLALKTLSGDATISVGGALTLANGNSTRTNLGLAIGTNVQAFDADLTTYAGITPSANVQTMLGSADNSAIRSNIGLAIGTNVQAFDGDLTTWAGITPGANVGTFLATPSSANLASAVTGETGSGALVFATSPTFTSSVTMPTSLAFPSNVDVTGIPNFTDGLSGVIGAVSARAGTFTTVTTSGNIELGDASANTLSATAGVLSIEGKTVLTGGIKRVAANFDKTNDTLANITGLSVTVAAGATYRFRAVLFINMDSVAGQKVAIAGTATATAIIYAATALDSAAALSPTSSRATALGAAVADAAGANESTTTVEGTIAVNAGGTLTVQFAQSTTDANASTVLAGSFFEVIGL